MNMEKANLSLKEQKEIAVTGHSGSTWLEVLVVCCAAPIGVAVCQSLLSSSRNNNKGKLSLLGRNFLVESLCLWLPLIVCQSEWLYPYGIGILMLELAMFVTLYYKGNKAPTSKKKSRRLSLSKDQKKIRGTKSSYLPYVTIYRSSILYLTFVAILAVDFPSLFPRRFCKTEVDGYGLMDMGAASFVISAGLVSRNARFSSRLGAEKSSQATIPKLLRSTLPLILLGLIRLVTNKGLDYQEHVSEYGVHWNFFFTLAFLSSWSVCVPLTPTWGLALLVLGTYQYALTYEGLQEYIESAPRTCSHISKTLWCQLFAANREGIAGCWGYLGIFLFSEVVGKHYLWSTQSKDTTKKMANATDSNPSLTNLSVLLWAVHFVLHLHFGIPVSRRSTNAVFGTWALAHNISLLAMIQGFSSYMPATAPLPLVMDNVNQHGLICFLVANVLTGLLNLTIPTLETNMPVALLILLVYIVLIGGTAVLVDWTVTTYQAQNGSISKKNQ